MANRIITPSMVAREAVMMLDNELVMANKVFRGYEEEFDKKPNGYSIGDTVTIPRPNDFTVRDGKTAVAQDVQEGKLTLVVDQFKGVDFKFTSQQLTQDIKTLSERVIKPAMIQLANKVDVDLQALYKYVPGWVGTPGQLINSFADFAKGPERLDEGAVPMDGRTGVLCPADHWALAGSQTALYNDTLNKPAYRDGETGKVGNVDLYSTQNVATHTVGAAATTSAVCDAPAGSGVLSTTWAASRDTNYMYLSTDGWDASTLKQGDVLELSDVYDVNPVTKATLAFKKQFVVMEDTVTASGDTAIKISPPIITSGAHQTVSNAPTDGTTTIAKVGTGGTGYRQNMIFHKNAFTLAMVPLVSPPGAVDVGRQTYKGLSVRVIPVYDGINDESMWRLDILYGVRAIDPRLAVRIAGT